MSISKSYKGHFTRDVKMEEKSNKIMDGKSITLTKTEKFNFDLDLIFHILKIFYKIRLFFFSFPEHYFL